MLYLIATPIGNLADITYRALTVIEQCDYLLCEDTRRSRILLSHYKLNKPLKSYHLFNEKSRLPQVLADLKEGKIIGLLSDAGTPCLADPGERLVAACHDNGLAVNPLPGPSAVLAALCSSGIEASRFQFVGFLPKKKGRLTRLLQEMLDYSGASICFETPHRIRATLQLFATLAPERLLFVGRELTKKFETHYRGTSTSILEQWGPTSPKGEFVVIVSPEE